MNRLIGVALLVISLAPTIAAAQNKLSDEEKKFLFEKRSKQIVDFKATPLAATSAAEELAKTAEGRAALEKAIVTFGKARRLDPDDLARNQRWELLIHNYWLGGLSLNSSKGKKVFWTAQIPDDMIPEFVSFFRLNAPINKVSVEQIDFLSEFGARASKALPELEKLRDTDESSGLGLAALKAISKIKGK